MITGAEKTADVVAALRIRNYLMTLRRHRDTSMALHGRELASTRELATKLIMTVTDIHSSFPNSPEVGRWVNKFMEYADQFTTA